MHITINSMTISNTCAMRIQRVHFYGNYSVNPIFDRFPCISRWIECIIILCSALTFSFNKNAHMLSMGMVVPWPPLLPLHSRSFFPYLSAYLIAFTSILDFQHESAPKRDTAHLLITQSFYIDVKWIIALVELIGQFFIHSMSNIEFIMNLKPFLFNDITFYIFFFSIFPK